MKNYLRKGAWCKREAKDFDSIQRQQLHGSVLCFFIHLLRSRRKKISILGDWLNNKLSFHQRAVRGWKTSSQGIYHEQGLLFSPPLFLEVSSSTRTVELFESSFSNFSELSGISETKKKDYYLTLEIPREGDSDPQKFRNFALFKCFLFLAV